MYKVSEFTKEIYKPKDIRKYLGNVTHQTLRRYDMDGKLNMSRTESGRRYITRDALIAYLKDQGVIYDDIKDVNKQDVIYARVSSHEQRKNGDLDRQALYIIENEPNLIKPLVLKEVGSGLNDNRAQLLKLIKKVMRGEVNKVYITYKDRLTRFGFNYLQTVFSEQGVEIVVVQASEEEKTPQEELVEDLIAIITSFSGRLYGQRSHKNKTKEKLLEAVEKSCDND